MDEVITIRECNHIMKSGNIFSFKCVTYDKKRKRGGELMEFDEAVLMERPKDDDISKDMGRPLTESEKVEVKKLQRHWDNYTRNLRILQNGTPTSIIKKIHPPLLIEFNGKQVIP